MSSFSLSEFPDSSCFFAFSSSSTSLFSAEFAFSSLSYSAASSSYSFFDAESCSESFFSASLFSESSFIRLSFAAVSSVSAFAFFSAFSALFLKSDILLLSVSFAALSVLRSISTASARFFSRWNASSKFCALSSFSSSRLFSAETLTAFSFSFLSSAIRFSFSETSFFCASTLSALSFEAAESCAFFFSSKSAFFFASSSSFFSEAASAACLFASFSVSQSCSFFPSSSEKRFDSFSNSLLTFRSCSFSALSEPFSSIAFRAPASCDFSRASSSLTCETRDFSSSISLKHSSAEKTAASSLPISEFSPQYSEIFPSTDLAAAISKSRLSVLRL